MYAADLNVVGGVSKIRRNKLSLKRFVKVTIQEGLHKSRPLLSSFDSNLDFNDHIESTVAKTVYLMDFDTLGGVGTLLILLHMMTVAC